MIDCIFIRASRADLDEVGIHMVTIADLFEKYASKLAYYSFFDNLSASMRDFSIAIKESALPSDVGQMDNIFTLLESFIRLLGNWHKNIQFGNEDQLNEFDASLISDMSTINVLWRDDGSSSEVENLDDIFDF